jgi:hypothetical protein
MVVKIALQSNKALPKNQPESLRPNGNESIPIPIKVLMELKIVCGAVELP